MKSLLSKITKQFGQLNVKQRRFYNNQEKKTDDKKTRTFYEVIDDNWDGSFSKIPYCIRLVGGLVFSFNSVTQAFLNPDRSPRKKSGLAKIVTMFMNMTAWILCVVGGPFYTAIAMFCHMAH